MNIFDGYEDKTPEEVAEELGVFDLSVIENSEKETIDILEKNNNSKKETNGIWISDFSMDIVKEKMKVKIGDTIGYIDEISSNKTQIAVDYYDDEKTFVNTAVFPVKSFLEKFSIYMPEEEIGNNQFSENKPRTMNYRFEDLKVGMTLNFGEFERKITEIISKNEIDTTSGKGERLTLPYNAVESVVSLSIYELDRQNPDNRISLSTIIDMYGTFPENLIIDETFVYNPFMPSFQNTIAKASKINTGYNVAFPFVSEGWNKETFIEKIRIHKNYFAQYQLGRTSTDLNLETTKQISEINNIKKGDKLVNLREKYTDFIIWQITDIKKYKFGTPNITLENFEDRKKIVTFGNIQQNYQLIVNALNMES